MVKPCIDLDAAAMAVHVAEAAGIHKDVEAELLSRAEAAQHFVVLAAMAQAQIDDLAPTAFARHLHRLPNLPVGMMAVLVEQRRRNLDFERLFVQQIDDRLAGAIGSLAISSAAAWRSSRRVSISYAFGSAYFTSVGATRTSRSNSCSARARQARTDRPNLRPPDPAATRHSRCRPAPVAAFFSDSPSVRTS